MSPRYKAKKTQGPTSPLPSAIQRKPDVEDITPLPAATDAERRASVRRDANQHAAIHFGETDIICDLLDLSESGARLRAANGNVPLRGQALMLTLFDSTVIGARVTWSRQSQFGVSFAEPVAGVDDKLDYEDLGQGYFLRAMALQKVARKTS
jgi:hypothetical protein